MYSDTYNNGRGVLKFESGGYINFIKSGLFNGNDRLKSITIPNSVTSIGENAFWYCSNLTSITIPNSVTEIGSWAFKGCTGELIVNCKIPSASSNSFGAFYNSKFTKVTIGDSVTSIGNFAFADCSCLTSITIPDSVTTIGGYAFLRCSCLTSITIPNSVTYIGGYAFSDCSSLTSITIPDSVTKIGGYAFEDYKIQSIIIDTVTGNTSYLENYFGANKISGYTGKYVSSDGCCLIKDNVLVKFLDRKKVSYTIPDSVTEIGEYAFDGCSGLTTITISESVTKIGNNAFVGCKNLYRMTCYASVPPIIDSFGEYMIIYVSKEAIKAYKKDPNWSIYKKQIKAIK